MLYLAGTIYYWLEKVITKTSNIKCMAAKFRVHLTALWKCINSRIYEGGMTAQKWKTSTISRDKTPTKGPKMKTNEKFNDENSPHQHFISLYPSPTSVQHLHPTISSPVAGQVALRQGSLLPCSAVTTHSCLTLCSLP